MEHKIWYPSLTSQFLICPIPFHFDTYRGCIYNCSYCFARDFITFSRRKSEHKESTYLVSNTPEAFTRWMNKVDRQSEYNYAKGEEVALKERIPLKIGATADPFPYIEIGEKTTYRILQILHFFDYPTEIQTKNPSVLASYCQEFMDANWIIAVTLISTDESFIKVCEPNAPTAQERLDAIKKLTDKGFKVMVKIQPAIYPKILKDLPSLIPKIAEAGCWAVNIEGLKIRISMPKEEQVLFQTIGDNIGVNLREIYRKGGEKTGSDWEMSNAIKMEYINLALSLCKEHKIKCLVADNNMGKVGDGYECCGTEVLKNYKIWGCNARTRSWGLADNESHELGKCIVNFTRSYDSKKPKTMNELAQKFLLPDWVEEAQEAHKQANTIKNGQSGEKAMIHTSFPDKERVYLEASPTIGTPSGGGHMPYIFDEVSIRRMTPIEEERLQGFPDDFTKFGVNNKGKKVKISDTQRYKCIGNAVTVPVVKEIVSRLLRNEEASL